MRTMLLCLLSMVLAMSTVTLGHENGQRTSLPPVESKGEMPLEEAIQLRRSAREFGRRDLALEDVSQLLWAAQGITTRGGFRTAPSAGALYPLELYVVAGRVEGLSAGVYRYRPRTHELVHMRSGDLRRPIASAALGQSAVRRAPAVLVIASVYRRTTGKYGERWRCYAHIEVGHAAQNIYLQAIARGLGTVLVGAFDDKEVQEVLGLPPDHAPLGLMPVGHKR
ncbi:MAG: SagB/ThcOx family dehydrogenase [Gammaproteobacteria bacterium]|nr:SagB/ThcOx family dehydrogenase [Gammaproteobacteria bacterium]